MKIQIDYELFADLYLYFYCDKRDEKTEIKIKSQIQNKIDKMYKRDLYNKIKNGTEEEKNNAKKEYEEINKYNGYII